MTETNTKGEISRTWTTDARRWAAVEQLRSDERYEAKRVQGIVTHRVRFPFYETLSAAKRLQYDEKGTSKTLNIDGIVNPFGLNREHVCMCVEEL